MYVADVFLLNPNQFCGLGGAFCCNCVLLTVLFVCVCACVLIHIYARISKTRQITLADKTTKRNLQPAATKCTEKTEKAYLIKVSIKLGNKNETMVQAYTEDSEGKTYALPCGDLQHPSAARRKEKEKSNALAACRGPPNMPYSL